MYDKHIDTLSARLAAYDVILGGQKYLAGNVRNFISMILGDLISIPSQEITLADLFHLNFGSLVGSDVMGSKPNVARYV